MTGEPQAAMRPADGAAAILDPVRAPFRALARTIVPETAALEEAEWAKLEAIVADALAQRPPALQRQLLVFIRALNVLPFFRWGRTFTRLDASRRTRFLHAMETSPVFLFRRGFWGLRTLVYMGYYGQAETYRRVGYTPHLRGWLEHPDAPSEAREATRRKLDGTEGGTP